MAPALRISFFWERDDGACPPHTNSCTPNTSSGSPPSNTNNSMGGNSKTVARVFFAGGIVVMVLLISFSAWFIHRYSIIIIYLSSFSPLSSALGLFTDRVDFLGARQSEKYFRVAAERQIECRGLSPLSQMPASAAEVQRSTHHHHYHHHHRHSPHHLPLLLHFLLVSIAIRRLHSSFRIVKNGNLSRNL